MDFSEQPRMSPTRMVSLSAVTLLHLVAIYAFATGAARRVVRSIVHPIETKVIVDATPLKPSTTSSPPPALDAPRLSRIELPYIPVPEIHLQQPLQPSPTAISAITNVKPETSAAPAVPTRVTPEASTPAPPTVAPPAAAKAIAPPPVRVPPVIEAARNCKKPEYPSASIRFGEAGTVLLRFLIDADGRVKSSEVQTSSGHKRLDDAARDALSLCRFKPGLSDGKPVEAWATLRYTWVLRE